MSDKDDVAAVMGERGTDIEGPDSVVIPRLALEWRVVGHHELAWGKERVGREVDRRTVENVPCRQRRI